MSTLDFIIAQNNIDIKSKHALHIQDTTEATSTSTGSLITDGGIGANGDIYAQNIFSNGNQLPATAGSNISISGGTISVVNNPAFAGISITNTTPSTAFTNGALVLLGGLGANGNIHISGNFFASGIQLPTTAGTNLSLSSGTISVVNNPSFSGITRVTNTTPSISKSTGALVVDGGLGVAGDIISDTLDASVVYTLSVETNVITTSSVLTVQGGRLSVPATTAATNQSTGALTIGGGVGIAGALYAGNIFSNGIQVPTTVYTAGTNINIASGIISVVNNPSFSGITTISNATQATNNTTGALIVSGGVAVAKDIYCANFFATGTNTNAFVPSTVVQNNSSSPAPYSLAALSPNVNTGQNCGIFIGKDTTNAGNSAQINFLYNGNNNAGNSISLTFIGGGGSSFGLNNTISNTGFNLNGGSVLIQNNTLQTTSSNTVANNSNALNVNGGIGFYGSNQLIAFNASGTNAPSLTNRSNGTKLLLFPNLSASTLDYSIGIRNPATNGLGASMTFTASTAADGFEWYAGSITPHLVLKSTQLLVLPTTTSTSQTTGALVVSGGVGIGGALYAGNIFQNGVQVTAYTQGTNISINSGILSVINNPSFSGAVTITNNTAATNTTSGALKVTGGIGTQGDIFAANGVTATAGVFTSETTTPLLTVDTLFSNSAFIESLKPISITDTTAATSTITGALIVAGGVGIAGTLYSGTIFSSGIQIPTVAGTNLNFSTNTVSVVNNPSFSGVVTITNNTTATSILTGALKVTGGISTQNSLYVGSDLFAETSQTFGLSSSGTARSSTFYSRMEAYAGFGPVFSNTGTHLRIGQELGNLDFSSGGDTDIVYISPVQFSGTVPVTISTATSFRIVGPPFQSTNMTIINSFSMYIDTGKVFIGDTTVSTSTSTGALTVAGDIGLDGRLFCSKSNTTSTVAPSGSTTVSNPKMTGIVSLSIVSLEPNYTGPGTTKTHLYTINHSLVTLDSVIVVSSSNDQFPVAVFPQSGFFNIAVRNVGAATASTTISVYYAIFN